MNIWLHYLHQPPKQSNYLCDKCCSLGLIRICVYVSLKNQCIWYKVFIHCIKTWYHVYRIMTISITRLGHMTKSITRNHTQSHAITRNHTQSRAITSNHAQSRSITRNNTQSHAITRNQTQSHAITHNHTQAIPRTLKTIQPNVLDNSFLIVLKYLWD
jgi:hypothetical protein